MGSPPNGGGKCKGMYDKIAMFANISLNLRRNTRYCVVTMEGG